MVSFSCEACGDIVTKKSLDKHRNQCRGATFSCLDCSAHFEGTDYRAHTSCISEAQKYQGSLYKEKEKKTKADKRRSMVRNDSSQAMVPRRAYVEDAPEGDDSQVIAVIDVPPRAPTPPPAEELPDSVNVFDYLVTDETPNGIKTAVVRPDEGRMIEHPSVYYQNGDSQYSQYTNGDHSQYMQYGFSYGQSPVHPSMARFDSWNNLGDSQASQALAVPPPPRYEYVTPLSKEQRKEKKDKDKHVSISEKKRKRNQVDELDLSSSKRPSSRDEPMTEAPVNGRVLHSGLTGGLTKLVTDSDFYADRISAGPTPISPAKRSRREEDKKERRKSSYVSYGTTTSKPNSSKHPSDDKHQRSRSPERKYHDDKHHHRARSLDRLERRYHDDRYRRREDHRTNHRDHRDSFSSEEHQPNRKKHVRAIEYPADRIDRPASVQPTSTNQIVSYKSRGDLFMSFIKKGPDSERGCSINKVLKRYHRERDVRGEEKDDEDKELWKALRVRKNERGEIVLFM